MLYVWDTRYCVVAAGRNVVRCTRDMYKGTLNLFGKNNNNYYRIVFYLSLELTREAGVVYA